ncbi:MAG: hypothetical protein RSF40_12015, partial [Oscillospiraceae bacterium]
SATYPDKDKHKKDECQGDHEHTSIKKEIKGEDGKLINIEANKKIKYSIPAQEFKERKYRTCIGDFYYAENESGKKQTYGISATIAAGKSIFWKLTKVRLTEGTVGICADANCKIHH